MSRLYSVTALQRFRPSPATTAPLGCSLRAKAIFLIAGWLYSVTALRENDQERVTENDQERVTVYTKHQLTLQALVTEVLGS